MLVVEGGPGTVETVHGACQRSIPVVLIKDSGRAADALAYAYNNLSKDFIENSEIEDKELMSVIKKNFQDIPSKDARDKEEKFKDLYEKIRGCIKHKKYVSYSHRFCTMQSNILAKRRFKLKSKLFLSESCFFFPEGFAVRKLF